jgi:hypothetical protein
LRAEWGPSSYGDIRHRAVGGITVPLPGKFSASVFLLANSGQPFNITTGLDPNSTGFTAARPALDPLAAPSACQSPNLKYEIGFGCFNLNPDLGVAVIGRNSARGPSAVNHALRLSRTWTFGPESKGAAPAGGGHGDGTPPGMSGTNPGKKYGVVLSASTLNALNHPNFAPPNGDLSSPYFGQYRSLGGLAVMSHGGAPSTYNRKIDLQLRFTF